MIRGDRTEKPDAGWSSDQGLRAGDFYILCPDNDVTREMDERRILWAAQDVILNRPPLSRWHPEHADAFRNFMAAPDVGRSERS